MISIGKFNVVNYNSIVRGQDKIYFLCSSIGMSSVKASKIATISSEMIRYLLRASQRSYVQAEIGQKNKRHVLFLRYVSPKWLDGISSPEFLQVFDDHFSGKDINGNSYVVGSKYLDVDFSLKQDLIEKIQKYFEALSQEEVVELTKKSKEALEIKNIELYEAKKMAEHASLAKTQFLANMSHEIRTPLNAIIGFSDILKKAELGEKEKKYCDIITESGNLLLELINDILDVSKIEAGKVELERIVFNLENLVENTLPIIKSKLKNDQIKLQYSYEKDLPNFFYGDPTRIRQVLLNFLSNAAKFTDEGSISVEVKVGKKNQDLSIGKKVRLCVAVKDTGLGIPQEKQKRIFEPFTQADNSTTRTHGGTGLGLTITKKLIEMMEGDIWLESKERVGSCFYFTLVLEVAPEIKVEKVLPTSIDKLKDKKVVIIDGFRQGMKQLENYLKGKECQVVRRITSEVEYQNWLSSKIDLVDILFMDPFILDQKGFCWIKEIHQKYPNLISIAVCSEAYPGLSRKAQEAGFKGFLKKPLEKDPLDHILEVLFSESVKNLDHIVTQYTFQDISTKGMRVLVAEDNRVNQKLIKLLLEKNECEVTFANNGKEAVKLTKECEFDICLMDLHMPEMGGILAAEKIRRELKCEMPIIALTASVLQEDRENCQNAGMNGFLTKPIDAAKLKETLASWFSKNE